MVFDSHLDLGFIIRSLKLKGRENVLRDLFLEDMRKGEAKLVIAAIFVDDIFIPHKALPEALLQISMLKGEIEQNGDDFMLVTDRKTLDECMQSSKIGILISLEGVEPIGDDIRLLDTFRDLGVRGLGMTWSRRNHAADGTYTGTGSGLTKLGLEIVQYAKDNGMYIDISHLNDEGARQVLAISKKPVMASHSNARSLRENERNLSDELIDMIRENEGFVGITGIKSFLAGKESTKQDYLDHLSYMLERCGEDRVGIGLDMCNMFSMVDLLTKKGSDWSSVDTITGYEDLGEVLGLIQEKDLSKIKYRNLLEFLNKVLS